MITSKENRYVRLAKSLLSAHVRKKSGLYIIEGPKLLQEALCAGHDIEFVLYSSDIAGSTIVADVINKKISAFEVSPSIFKNISDMITPQGLIAVLRQENKNWRDLLKKKRFLTLALDGVQDPGNAGTMIRTADALGFDAVIMGAGSVEVFNPKTLRAAMGSTFHIPIYNNVHLPDMLNALDTGVAVLSTAPRGDISIEQADISCRTIIVIGSEAHGISQQVLNRASASISIEMPGKAESLNASVAAGIIIYEVSRKWRLQLAN